MQENIPYYPLKSSARGLDFSVSSSSSIPISEQIHYHDYYQIYYIRQGYIFHHVGDRHLKLARGDCFINSPYTPHRIEMGPNTAFYFLLLPQQLHSAVDHVAAGIPALYVQSAVF